MGFDINKDGEGKEDMKKGFSLDKDDVGSDDKKSGGFDLDKDAAGSDDKKSGVFDLDKGAAGSDDKKSGGFDLGKDEKSESTGGEKGSKKGLVVGLFIVAALVVVGLLMFGGGDNDEEPVITGTVITEDDEETAVNDAEGEVEVTAVPEDNAIESDTSAQEDISLEVENDGTNDAPSISEGELVNIPVVSFSKGSASDVTYENGELIDKIVNYLNSNPTKNLVVYGYASSEGDINVNQRISKARAESFASVIQSNGISSSRIRSEGKGIENPIASNDSEPGRQKNRRVEISFE